MEVMLKSLIPQLPVAQRKQGTSIYNRKNENWLNLIASPFPSGAAVLHCQQQKVFGEARNREASSQRSEIHCTASMT